MAADDVETVEILLVEDNPADIRYIQEVFKEAKVANRVRVAETGEEALAVLRGEDGGDGPRPNFVLLDLELPRMDGREVLAEIKNDPALTDTPVVVLTSLVSETDIARSFDLQAASYVTKPMTLKKLMRVLDDVAPLGLQFVLRKGA